MPKATFSTCVSKLPLDTTQYEFEESPENAVMNWYMLASDGWRYEWDYEIYRENINSTDVDKQESAKKHLDMLLNTIEAQKITPERQKLLASQFYEDIGRGCSWGNHANFNDDEHGPSMDAWLLGCASCGFRDYCVQNAYRQYHKVDLNKLAVLELDSDDLTLYRNQKNIMVSLPINENGDCADFRPFDCRSVYYQPQTTQCKEAWYHLHPEFSQHSAFEAVEVRHHNLQPLIQVCLVHNRYYSLQPQMHLNQHLCLE